MLRHCLQVVIAVSVALAIGVRPWIAEGAPAMHAAELRSDDWQQSMGRYHGIPQQDRADGPVRGLQDGWANNNVCGVMFTPMVAEEIATAGASWVRINFRLGGSYNWTEVASCDGASALDSYDTVVSNARAAGLNVLGLLSNESWPGSQAAWQANSAEQNPGSSGDNAYLEAFSHDAACVLFEHFSGRVAAWEVWNEPNAYTSYAPGTGYTGSTFIYPSNFAWLLRRVYEEGHAGGGPKAVPFWFQLRDIAAANLYYGLLTPFDPPWTRKPAWDAYSAPPNPPTPTDTSTPTFTPTGTLTQTPTDALTPNPSSTPAVTPTSTVTAMPVLNFSYLPLVLRSDSPDARDVGARG